jgi:succinoglycan biosynthesis protein ExoM
MLEAFLDSILNLEIPEPLTLQVDVIENDTERSAENLVSTKNAAAPFSINYHQQTTLGIPFARNLGIEKAIQDNCDFVIFIDDDEIAETHWLSALYDCSKAHQHQAIIAGPVNYTLEKGCPEYLHPFFQQKEKADNAELKICASNNAWVPITTFTEHGLRFDESMAFTGGTDSVLFSQAFHQGIKIIHAKNALVHETVPKARANLKWLSKRKYRQGLFLTSGKLPNKIIKKSKIPQYIFRALFNLVKAAGLFLLLNKKASAKAWLQTCKHTGAIMGFKGLHYQPYKSIEGK